MKREEVKARFEGITDEQLDWLMEQNGRDVNAMRSRLDDSKAATGELQRRVAELQAQLDSANRASMTAEEQLQAQLEAAEQAKRDFAVKSSRLDAKAVFVEAGIPDDSMDGLLDLVAGEDGAKSVERSKALVSLIKGQSDKAVAEARKSMVGSTPKPKGGEGGGAMTKDAFLRLGYGRQQEMLKDNPGLLGDLK